MKSYGSSGAMEGEDRGLLLPSRIKIVAATHGLEEQKEYACFCIPWSWISNNGDDPMIGNISTVILLLNSMIGSGILGTHSPTYSLTYSLTHLLTHPPSARICV